METRFQIGGFTLDFDLPRGLSFEDADYGPFRETSVNAQGCERLPLEMIPGSIPERWLRDWTPASVILDTESTWALRRTGDAEWPYHLGPSPSRPSEPPLFHLLTGPRFERARIYLGDDFSGDVLIGGHFYPLDEVFMRHRLAMNKGLLVHASALEIDGKGYLFLGDSGAGKSTIAELFETQLGSRARVLSDDRVILRQLGDRWLVFGSPWHGTLPRAQQGGVELAALCFLEQTPAHEFERFGRTESLARLLQIYLGVWWLDEFHDSQLQSLRSLISTSGAAIVRLGFAPNPSIVDFLFERLKTC